MALHDENKNLAIKWARAVFKYGYSLDEACKLTGEWYSVDYKIVKNGVLNESVQEGIAFIESAGSQTKSTSPDT